MHSPSTDPRRAAGPGRRGRAGAVRAVRERAAGAADLAEPAHGTAGRMAAALPPAAPAGRIGRMPACTTHRVTHALLLQRRNRHGDTTNPSACTRVGCGARGTATGSAYSHGVAGGHFAFFTTTTGGGDGHDVGGGRVLHFLLLGVVCLRKLRVVIFRHVETARE